MAETLKNELFRMENIVSCPSIVVVDDLNEGDELVVTADTEHHVMGDTDSCWCADEDYWWDPAEKATSYEVEAILAERYCKDKDEVRYLTKWLYYDIKRATWEPEEHFGGTTVADWKKKLRQEGGEETPFDLKVWREYRDSVWREEERQLANAARKRSRPADLDINDSPSSSEAEESREVVGDYEGVVQRLPPMSPPSPPAPGEQRTLDPRLRKVDPGATQLSNTPSPDTGVSLQKKPGRASTAAKKARISKTRPRDSIPPKSFTRGMGRRRSTRLRRRMPGVRR
jgi:hypothetical protein